MSKDFKPGSFGCHAAWYGEPMSTETLNAYFHKLKPAEKAFIVACVKELPNRRDFHTGLLPFIRCGEVSILLQRKLKRLELNHDAWEANPEINPKVTGIRFIKGILSKFAEALVYYPFDDEASELMTLSDKKLSKRFKNYSHKFTINANYLSSRSSKVISLQRLGPNSWFVTTDRREMQRAIHWLTHTFAMG
jgi:hypothetical protein